MNSLVWRRRERRVFGPYPDFSAILGEVAFSPSENIDLKRSESQILVEAESDPAPRLILSLDGDRLAAMQIKERSKLSLAVIVKFPTIRNSMVIGPWKLTEAPKEYKFDGHDVELWPKVYEVAILLVGSDRVPGAPGLLSWVRYGAKTFKVTTETQDADFPVKFVDGAEFVTERHSKNALWMVHCKSDDFEQRPEACFEIWLNKRADGRLQGAIASGTAGKLLNRELFSEMQFEIAVRVFASAERPENDDGLCARLTKRLTDGSNLEFEDLRKMARDYPERLRSLVQEASELTSSFESADIRRRRS